MIAIDLFGKNTNIDLSVAYKDFTNLKNDVKGLNVGFSKIKSLSSLSSLDTLSSLTGDILSLSNWCSSLDHWNLQLYSEFNELTDGLDSILIPMVFSNSSAIESLIGSFNEIDTYLINSVEPSIHSNSSNIESLSSSLSILNDSFYNFTTVLVPMIFSNSYSLNALSSSVLSLNNDVSNINSSLASLQQSCSDITNSLSTLTGVYTANSFNNQAFNTTLNLNSDMFFTGQFGLNSGFIDCSSGIWDLRELKPTTLSSLTATNLSNLKMENFNLSTYDLHYSNKCYFDGCSLLNCGVNGKKCVLENCLISGGNLDNRLMEFKFDSFYNSIHIWNGGVFSFCNVDFYTDNFKFIMHGTGRYRIYIMDCLIYGTTSQGAAFMNMFSNAAGVNIEYAMY